MASGVLAGIAGVFAATHSVLITMIATIAVVVLTAMVLIGRR